MPTTKGAAGSSRSGRSAPWITSPPVGAIVFECGRWERGAGVWEPAECGAGRNDRQGAAALIKVRPEDCERAFQLFQWILLRRGEYGEPLRMM
jgi:hypothetical protein